ncbi:hypothetical protein V8E54_001510 [Elaphomyces granulatus]
MSNLSERSAKKLVSIPYCVGGLVGGAGGSRIRPITLVSVSRTRFDVPWFYENAKPCLRRVRYASSNKSSKYLGMWALGMYRDAASRAEPDVQALALMSVSWDMALGLDGQAECRQNGGTRTHEYE